MVDKTVILRKLADLEKHINQITEYSNIKVIEYAGDWKTQRIVERTLQMMIEICADIASHRNHAAIVKRIDGLSPDMIQEVIDFIDFLKLKRREGIYNNRESLKIQEASLDRIWGSESEDLYEL